MFATRTLLEIGDDIRVLDELLDECSEDGGELSPGAAAAFESLHEAIRREEAAKLDQCANYLRTLAAEEAAVSAEADYYAKHAKKIAGRIRRMKDFIRDYIEQSGRTKVKTETHRTFAVQQNGGVQPMRWLVAAIDPATLPPEFTRRVVDEAAVRRELEAGNPDALAIAVLEPRGRHLRIR